MAKDGQMDAVKVMAKDLVRNKRYVKITTLKSQDAMMQAMKGVTKAMSKMNRQMKLPQVQKSYDASNERCHKGNE